MKHIDIWLERGLINDDDNDYHSNECDDSDDGNYNEANDGQDDKADDGDRLQEHPG